jgi:hypothetical protein
MSHTQVPELPHGCRSWVVTSPSGHVYELPERADAQKALDAGWRVETVLDYLCRVNCQIREQAQAQAVRS